MASPEDLPNKSILKQSTNNDLQGNNSSRKSSIASSDQETYSRRSSLTTGSGRCHYFIIYYYFFMKLFTQTQLFVHFFGWEYWDICLEIMYCTGRTNVPTKGKRIMNHIVVFFRKSMRLFLIFILLIWQFYIYIFYI